jgi:hypothetical protein
VDLTALHLGDYPKRFTPLLKLLLFLFAAVFGGVWWLSAVIAPMGRKGNC